MTAAELIAFYPQFAGFEPAVVLTEYIRQANARFGSFSPEDAEEARRLYTAHKLTMYARVALPGGGEVTGNEQSPQWGAAMIDGAGARHTYAQLWVAGQPQHVSSKKIGELSVTYSFGTSSSSASVRTDLADLPETSFGLQLLALLRLYGHRVYVP